MNNPAARIYINNGHDLYGVIKSARSTEKFVKEWFYGICYHCQDNDVNQIGKTLYRVVNRAGAAYCFTNWDVDRDYCGIKERVIKHINENLTPFTDKEIEIGRTLMDDYEALTAWRSDYATVGNMEYQLKCMSEVDDIDVSGVSAENVLNYIRS